MKILFHGSVAKFSDRPEENEDSYFVDEDKERLVVCDGASESFDAKNWAKILVETAAKSDLVDLDLYHCLDRYNLLHNPSEMSWSKAAAYERGSFSTLIIAQNDITTKSISITTIGDSLALLTDGKKIIKSLPYKHSNDFQLAPMLISTVIQHNEWMKTDDNVFIKKELWGYTDQSPLYLLCLTDALGAWLFKCIEDGSADVLQRLVNIRSEIELLDLVEHERTIQMKRDDTTLIIAQLSVDLL